jgi:hypothetical protein
MTYRSKVIACHGLRAYTGARVVGIKLGYQRPIVGSRPL